MSVSRFRYLHDGDDVAVAVEAASAGSRVEAGGFSFVLAQDVPGGHKVAVRPLKKGAPVIKYGFPIGTALEDIPAGGWVHTHNVATRLAGEQEYSYEPSAPSDYKQKFGAKASTFQGYKRADGSVGVRNEVWIIPTVGCVNGIAQRAVEEARRRFGSAAGIDAIQAFPHPYGCSQLGEDHENTRIILADLVRHPNAGAVLVMGLGCENNTIASFKELLGDVDPARVKFLVTQDADDELEAALEALEALVSHAAKAKREACPVSSLIVGMKCGGSDGFSGVTANPLLGSFTDRIVARGGSAILTEVPEMFGAETMLMARAADRSVFDATVSLINDFKAYYIAHNQVVYDNPSPGNKQGGITTLEDKSLGCVQKGGTVPVSGVYPYGGRVDKKGLLLLSGPGNDIISVTALAAAGAQIVLFTTGRGTPLGGPVPTVKVSSNSDLARRKANWVDFDAGVLLDASGPEAVAAVEEEFYEFVLSVASGEETRNETNGYREISIFKDGVVL